MGPLLHGSATTTHPVGAAIQRRRLRSQALSRKDGVNSNTIAKGKKGDGVSDAALEPKEPASTVLSTGDCQEFCVWAMG